MAEFENPGESGFAPPQFQPIRALDVKRVRENYGIQAEPKFARGTADVDIYKFSTKAVINWWKKLKAQEAAAKGAAGSAGSTGGASGAGGGSGGGGSTSGYNPTQSFKPNYGVTEGVEATPTKPAVAPAPVLRPAPTRTIASESTTAGITRLAPVPTAPAPTPGTLYRPQGGNTGLRAY